MVVLVEELECLESFRPILILETLFPFVPLPRERILEIVRIEQDAQKLHVWPSVNLDEVIPQIKDYIPSSFALPAAIRLGGTRFQLEEMSL